jgi:50S ribosomal protein L16 3-hydroxylase
MLPDEISPEEFLSTYWQKKPLLLKNAFPEFQDPLSPEELAGLACEEEIEARLVFHENDTWRLKTGPFVEQDFTSLPENNWTLLVQAVDHWFPAAKQLLSNISFIPSWRLDDVMVSYATENAGVGPHFDYYDVFIIQGQGQRRWQLGQHCDDTSPLMPDTELKILQNFIPQEEFTLQAGDALYIPPGLAHHGIALNDSLSYSIGFRAPSYAELISQFAARLCAELTEDQRYSDPDLKLQPNLAEISHSSLSKAKSLIQIYLQDAKNFEYEIEQGFAQMMTQRKYPELTYLPDTEFKPETLKAALAQGLLLEKHPAARFAFYKQDNTLFLFVDGNSLDFPAGENEINKMIPELCDTNKTSIDSQTIQNSPDCLNLVCKLYNQGSLIEANLEN